MFLMQNHDYKKHSLFFGILIIPKSKLCFFRIYLRKFSFFVKQF